MPCILDLCEFLNILFGGLIVGLLASYAFIALTECEEMRKFQRMYSHLASEENHFDWIAYNIIERKLAPTPNGSVARVMVKKDSIEIYLQHDQRQWTGHVLMVGKHYGTLTFKYDEEFEFGRRDFITGSYTQNGKEMDYIFLVPIGNKVNGMKVYDENKIIPSYEYGNEILIREKKEKER